MNATLGTKPPYYGNIAVAAFLGDTIEQPVSIVNVPFSSPYESSYAAYSAPTAANNETTQLLRAILINMRTYNTTFEGSGLGVAANVTDRPSSLYALDVTGTLLPGDSVAVQRLWANGSDAISGITWDGWSYNYELSAGRPVRLSNVTVGEVLVVGDDGAVEVEVPDSSAVVLNFVGNGTVG